MSSVAVCPSCGAHYLASVPTCADCGVALAGGVAGELGDDAVSYDLVDWTPEQKSELAAGLETAGVAHHWDGSELVVAEADADGVEVLIEEIDHPDALDVDESDDDGGAEVLSALYVASDVLLNDPYRSAAAADLREATSAAAELPAPYGLDGATWDAVRSRARALVEVLAGNASEEEVVGAARSLREAVLPLV